MWKSLMESVVKAFAMCDPVAYIHYLECKLEAEQQAPRTPSCETVDTYIDQWTAMGERKDLWQNIHLLPR